MGSMKNGSNAMKDQKHFHHMMWWGISFMEKKRIGPPVLK